jgi:hypothetical protein
MQLLTRAQAEGKALRPRKAGRPPKAEAEFQLLRPQNIMVKGRCDAKTRIRSRFSPQRSDPHPMLLRVRCSPICDTRGSPNRTSPKSEMESKLQNAEIASKQGFAAVVRTAVTSRRCERTRARTPRFAHGLLSSQSSPAAGVQPPPDSLWIGASDRAIHPCLGPARTL